MSILLNNKTYPIEYIVSQKEKQMRRLHRSARICSLYLPLLRIISSRISPSNL